MRETEMYLPVKAYFEKAGYETKAEVKDCDILAYKDGLFTAVELKKNFTLALLYQAVERQRFCQYVYVAIPYPKGGGFQKSFRKKMTLCQCLKIGLLTIRQKEDGFEVKEYVAPSEHDRYQNHRRKKSVRGEFEKRKTDLNEGGSTGKPLITAHRERALQICAYLQEKGPTRAKLVTEALDMKEAGQMLYHNVYGWFERKEKGIYALSRAGKEAILTYGYVIEEMRIRKDEDDG